MNALAVARDLQTAFIRYLTTTFDIGSDPDERPLAEAIRRSWEQPGTLFRGPFLELSPPFRSSYTDDEGRQRTDSLNSLIADGVLSEVWRSLPCIARNRPLPIDAPLYAHQARAIRRVMEGRNVVVASGTGSGKTECFLIPIIDDLLRDTTPGVRALLVYPMNALVNDQLDRLRSLLRGSGITFGRYTSELAQTEAEARRRLADQISAGRIPAEEVISRERVRGNASEGVPPEPPQILITNYAMLEYLLLRPEDSPLFQSGRWRHVVLDEAHTYAGAQGIEVSLLLRRLKHRLGKRPGEVGCLATSATLTQDDQDAAADFAATLFGESFTREDVVFGEVEDEPVLSGAAGLAPDPTSYLRVTDGALDVIRTGTRPATDLAAHMTEAGIPGPAPAADESACAWLHRALEDNPDLYGLREWMRDAGPVTLEDAGAHLFPDLAPDEAAAAACRLVELGAGARIDEESSPLLPARYHLFARAPHGVWVCLNLECRQDDAGDRQWSRAFTEKHDTCPHCGCAVYEITVCRSCGQVYVRAWNHEGEYATEPDFPDSPRGREYFVWRDLSSQEPDEVDEPSEEELPEQEPFTMCVGCRHEAGECTCGSSEAHHVRLWRLLSRAATRRRGRGPRLPIGQPTHQLKRCRRCGSQARGRRAEIVTPVALRGDAPLSVLTEELYGHLAPSSSSQLAALPGAGRKLLCFTDSRQGAAKYAAYLQDTTNRSLYRHVIVEAARRLNEQGRLPDLNGLAEEMVTLCDEYGVYANDLSLFGGDPPRPGRPLTREQRLQLVTRARAQVLGEFCARTDVRHSLSALGLVACEHFEHAPAADEVASALDLDGAAASAVVNALIDTMRLDKAVTLPSGVSADDEAFGRHRGHCHYVLTGQRSLNRPAGERYWIGESDRQRRFDFMARVLAASGRPSEEADVRRVLALIWDWLQEATDLLVGDARGGYQIDHTRLTFDTRGDWYRCDRCLRLTRRASPACPTHHCPGSLRQADPHTELSGNHYHARFATPPLGLRVEEHTAQLEPTKGQQYQDLFRNGRINVLSCSTTFELGVDLGELQSVVLNNVPPTVANYRQRAGRAGRRVGGAAFILTYSIPRPHDQTHFRSPAELIRGEVRVPHLALDNPFIAERHVNALIMSRFLRYLVETGREDWATLAPFFDLRYPEGAHVGVLEGWCDESAESVLPDLRDFEQYHACGRSPREALAAFADGLREQAEYVQRTLADYDAEVQRQVQTIADPYADGRSQAESLLRRFSLLAQRLREESLIDFLSSRGFLPSYSFPIHVVKLNLPPRERRRRELRLERDLSRAIVEYAPGNEIVADKRIWKSGGIAIRLTPRTWAYRVCRHCSHLVEAGGPGLPLRQSACPVCDTAAERSEFAGFEYIQPDGFQTDWQDAGRPAGQYAERGENHFRVQLWAPGQGDEHHHGVVRFAYRRFGEMLAVNSGPIRDGFRLCWTCGAYVPGRRTDHRSPYGRPCLEPDLHTTHLGHRFTTDTLHVRFVGGEWCTIPPNRDLSFWRSLLYALLAGASRALHIERRDLDGVLAPCREGNTWTQELVLFDNVPGGAGHVLRIRDEFAPVVRAAIEVTDCDACAPDTSCYGCLRDYGNQIYHEELERGPVHDFLSRVAHRLT